MINKTSYENQLNMPLSSKIEESTIIDYRNNGFIVARELYPSAVIEAMKEEIARLRYFHTEKVHLEPSVKNTGDTVEHKIYNFLESSPFFKNFACAPDLLEVVNRLTGWKCVLCTDKINLKLPGGREFYPHQDMSGMWSKYMSNIISVFIAIDKATIENGCLELAPAQHTSGILGEYMRPISEENLSKLKFIPIELEPGDVIFFDGFLPHRSGPNLSDKSRTTLLLSYNDSAEGDFRSKFISGN